MEKAGLSNVFTDLLEINRQVLEVLELPGLEMLIQFRLREVNLAFAANNHVERSGCILGFILCRIRLRFIRVLWVQGLLLVGEATIKIYAESQVDEVIEPQKISGRNRSVAGRRNIFAE